MVSDIKNKDPDTIVRRMGALQAQNFQASLLAIGIRCGNDSMVSDVQSSLDSGKIVRTWHIRGTIHICASDDVKWMFKPGSGRLLQTALTRDKHLGLSQELIQRAYEILRRTLKGKKILTRSNLYDYFEKSGIPVKNNIGYHLLYRAAWDGLICFGPHEDDEPSFALLDDWAPSQKEFPYEEMLGELTVRYFNGHGPATIQDFAWWAGIKISEARAGIVTSREFIRELEFDGRTYYFHRENASRRNGDENVYLLPAFDEYIIGYTDRSMVTGDFGEIRGKQDEIGKFIHSNGIFLPTIISNGKVVGTWKGQMKSGKINVTLNTFNHLDRLIRSDIKDRVSEYGRFLGVDAELMV